MRKLFQIQQTSAHSAFTSKKGPNPKKKKRDARINSKASWPPDLRKTIVPPEIVEVSVVRYIRVSCRRLKRRQVDTIRIDFFPPFIFLFLVVFLLLFCPHFFDFCCCSFIWCNYQVRQHYQKREAQHLPKIFLHLPLPHPLHCVLPISAAAVQPLTSPPSPQVPLLAVPPLAICSLTPPPRAYCLVPAIRPICSVAQPTCSAEQPTC